MMNLGPPPPPPPPPFSTGVTVPSPKPPAEMVSRPQPPVAEIPAALAGAMLKDKKPFTYTPGGINLAEIKSPRMQRRLQRNASMEGVRPSPLAQQPSPPPSGATPATIPPHGMIQVLPMPGVGMTPVVKPQPREPPKPKRSVCGPAPLPPPFVVSSESSIEALSPPPSATPNITSPTPPTTPSTFSSVSAPSPSPSSSSSAAAAASAESVSEATKIPDSKPASAPAPGPLVPPPPPPPPPSSTLKKRFSLPSSSSTPSSAFSKPENDDAISTDSAISSCQLSKSSTTAPSSLHSPFVNGQSDSLSDASKTKDFGLGSSDAEISADAETKAAVNGVLSDTDEKNEDPSCEKGVFDSPVSTMANSLISESQNRSDVERMDNGNSFGFIGKHSPEPAPNDREFNSRTVIPDDQPSQTGLGKTIPNFKPTAVDSQMVAPNVEPAVSNSVMNIPTFKPVVTDSQKMDPPTVEPESSKPAAKFEPVVCNFAKGMPKFESAGTDSVMSKAQTTGTESTQSNAIYSMANSANFAPKSPARQMPDESDDYFSRPPHPHPFVRMASPPTRSQAEMAPRGDRFGRQASLPADPASPPVSKSEAALSSAQWTPTKAVSAEEIQSPDARTLSPSPSWPVRAPLPWMLASRGKKEASPPPEFLAHSQRIQERIQRQRSLGQQKKKSAGLQRNSSADGFGHVASYSDVPCAAPLSPPLDRGSQSTSPHPWRSPHHTIASTKDLHGFPSSPALQEWIPVTRYAASPQTTSRPEEARFDDRSRERVIPIALEDSPPATPSGRSEVPWRRTKSVPSSPMGDGRQPRSADFEQSRQCNSSALEALQQMQHNLAQLNSGLQTGNTQPQTNGFSVPIQYGGASEQPVTQSRSFRILQNAYDNQDSIGPPAPDSASPEPRKYSGSSIPSRSFRMLQAMTNTEDPESSAAPPEHAGGPPALPNGIPSPPPPPSFPPSSHGGLKSASPIVNGAPFRSADVSPRLWSSPPKTPSPPAVGNARLLEVIKREQSSSDAEPPKAPGGPFLRPFRQGQSNGADRGPQSRGSSPGTDLLPRVMHHLRLDAPGGGAEAEDLRSGVLETASAKQSVLEELTSQFDPQASLKKPRAAPGRVFRYLQQQYDDPCDSAFGSSSSSVSPNTFVSDSSGIDSGLCEAEPKPYSGCRIPGRTFRLLQENIETHPTVLQARK